MLKHVDLKQEEVVSGKLKSLSESSDISPCSCVGFEAKEKMVVNAPVFELLASSHADVVPPDKTTFLDLEI